jgi:DNA-binding winged helix-turn-helix (wHTH) protein
MRRSRSIISFSPHPCPPVFHIDQWDKRLFQDEDLEPIELGELREACIEVLVYLIKNSKRVVSVEELIRAAFAGDGDARQVRKVIRAIRAAIYESSGEQLTIRTHRGGYQFIAELVATDFVPPPPPGPIRTVYKSR